MKAAVFLWLTFSSFLVLAKCQGFVQLAWSIPLQRGQLAAIFTAGIVHVDSAIFSSQCKPMPFAQGRFPYWFSDQLQSSCWSVAWKLLGLEPCTLAAAVMRTDPAADWEEQLAFASRTQQVLRVIQTVTGIVHIVPILPWIDQFLSICMEFDLIYTVISSHFCINQYQLCIMYCQTSNESGYSRDTECQCGLLQDSLP